MKELNIQFVQRDEKDWDVYKNNIRFFKIRHNQKTLYQVIGINEKTKNIKTSFVLLELAINWIFEFLVHYLKGEENDNR